MASGNVDLDESSPPPRSLSPARVVLGSRSAAYEQVARKSPVLEKATSLTPTPRKACAAASSSDKVCVEMCVKNTFIECHTGQEAFSPVVENRRTQSAPRAEHEDLVAAAAAVAGSIGSPCLDGHFSIPPTPDITLFGWATPRPGTRAPLPMPMPPMLYMPGGVAPAPWLNAPAMPHMPSPPPPPGRSPSGPTRSPLRLSTMDDMRSPGLDAAAGAFQDLESWYASPHGAAAPPAADQLSDISEGGAQSGAADGLASGACDEHPGALPSAGSNGHASGKCKPCAFFHRPNGCADGASCTFCHLCDADEKKRRRKVRLDSIRQRKQKREAAASSSPSSS